jgi:HAE1 family hydrophobic/amphiphilic exporter-1
MAAGMLPTALGLGEGSEFRQPMAIAVIGGLITSTALSLVLVRWSTSSWTTSSTGWKPRFGRLVTRRDPTDVPDPTPAE